MHDEADLTPKPGLVDQRGSGAHTDMDLAHAARLSRVRCTLRSPNALHAARELSIGPALRARYRA